MEGIACSECGLTMSQSEGLAELEALKADAERYRWLRDNKHLDIWWSVSGSPDRCANIDADIDAAMSESPNLEVERTLTSVRSNGELGRR